MSQTTLPAKAPQQWKSIHAYGLPAGSVRALMALLIFATLWGRLLLRPDLELPESLRDLLFIILGHYFAVRGRTAAGDESGPPPLYLPRGAVRLLLFAGFVAVAVVLGRNGALFAVHRNPGVLTLLLAFGFLLGVALQKLASWFTGPGHALPRWIEDWRATISLMAAVALALLVWDEVAPFLPSIVHRREFSLGRYGPEHLLAAVVGFYFGSRS